MPKLTSHPDEVSFECHEGDSVLKAASRAKIHFAHACGGQAKCSTCRIWILSGAEGCPPPNDKEQALRERVGLDGAIRLACQLHPTGDIAFRRLVLDETDLAIANQLRRGPAHKAGELRKVAIFFSDIAGFTTFAEDMTPYDVMYLLNRYFAQAGAIIEDNFGYVDKFVGDGMMAIFGSGGEADAPIRAVKAALETLAMVDRMKPFLKTMYGLDFDIRIGVHYGEALIGSVGSIGNERLTAIGDVVNVASRVEAANKDAGTRFLITEALHDEVRDQVETSDFIRVRLRGTSERITLYEIAKLTDETERELDQHIGRETMRADGRLWTRVLEEGEVKDGQHRVVQLPKFDLVVARRGEHVVAFENACPHLRLPFFDRAPPPPEWNRPEECAISDALSIRCRWHSSRFDLLTGEVLSWCEALNSDGTPKGLEFLGDVTTSRARLEMIPCRIEAGHIWVALE